MKELKTISEYQLLCLARKEIFRRIDELRTQILQGKTKQSVRRTDRLISRYNEQIKEINERIDELDQAYAGDEGED